MKRLLTQLIFIASLVGNSFSATCTGSDVNHSFNGTNIKLCISGDEVLFQDSSQDLFEIILQGDLGVLSTAGWTLNGNDIYRISGNVGIGTSTPGEALYIKGSEADIRLENTTARIVSPTAGDWDLNIGNSASTSSASGYSSLGFHARYGSNWEYSHIIHETYGAGEGNSRIHIGGYTGVYPYYSNYLTVDNGNGVVSINGLPTNSNHRFWVNGTAWSTGSWQGSDSRFKKNVKRLSLALDKVTKLRGVTYGIVEENSPPTAISTNSVSSSNSSTGTQSSDDENESSLCVHVPFISWKFASPKSHLFNNGKSGVQEQVRSKFGFENAAN